MVGAQDYQRFAFRDGKLTDIGDLMQQKLRMLPHEWCKGSILDVGTDHGFWCFYALENGADCVLGLDRGRPVNGTQVDLVKRNQALATAVGAHDIHFAGINLGRQWLEFGVVDNVLMFSCYHHIYNNCLDHNAIWYWLRQHTGKVLWWEGAMSATDQVVQKDVADTSDYTRDAILNAASQFFTCERIGHSPIAGRELWRFVPIQAESPQYQGKTRSGAGGASKAFEYGNGRRINEIAHVLGWAPVPGSLNIVLDEEFDWDSRYYRMQISDVENRKAGLDSAWNLRWCRFYPVRVGYEHRWVGAAVMRFEGEKYSERFVELISTEFLRAALEVHGDAQVKIRSL